MLLTPDRLTPREHYTVEDISPHFWPNGKMPVREDWKRLAADHFKDHKLKISGLVENPAELSLDDLHRFGEEETITMHHCIQGWSGIAQWCGVSLRKIIEYVRPLPYAKTIVFYSFGGALYGGSYYDMQDLYNALKPECMLAFEMNDQPLPLVYGAPLRLGVEYKRNTRWSSGLSASSLLNPKSWSERARAARTKMTNISIYCPTSERLARGSIPVAAMIFIMQRVMIRSL